MHEYFIISFVFTIYLYFTRNKGYHNFLIVMILTAILIGLREGFGNDYYEYENYFLNSDYGISLFEYGEYESHEIGWYVLNKLFSGLGFGALLLAITLIFFYSLAKVIKNNVQPDCYWLSYFIVMFFPSITLLNMSAMRQSVAVSIIYIGLSFAGKFNTTIKSFISPILASLFHKSALIMLFQPIFIKLCSRYVLPVIVFLYFGLFFAGPELFLPLISMLSDKYQYYDGISTLGSGFGLIFFTSFFLYIVILIYKFEKNIFASFILLYFLLIPLGVSMHMIGRFSLYLAPAFAVYLPMCMSNFMAVKRIAFISITIVIVAVMFFEFCISPTYVEYYKNLYF